MTLVKIDIKNVASETHSDDRVVFYSPELREAPGGGITSTAEAVVPLVNGVGEKELTPGPVTVTFQCRGIADTKPKRGTVPDEGPVELGDVIAGDFAYTPAVVSAAVQARNEAQDAADRAEAGTDRVGTAEQVGQWARDAQGSAESTDADRGAVAADRQAVAQDKSDISALTGRAETAASDAETHAELAEVSAGIATEASNKATASEQAAAQSASDAEADRVAAEQARARAMQAENTATGAATTATNKATEAGLAADRAEAATAGKADLIGGKVPTSQIPEIALTKPSQVVSRAEILALNAQEGDIAIITTGADKGTYILGPGASNVFTSWVPMAVSADVPVQSVNGQVGNVNLGASDVDAAPTNHTHTPESIGAASASHTHTSVQISDATWDATANTAVKRDANGKFQVGTPTESGQPTPKSYVDSGLAGTYTAMYKRPALFSGAGNPPSTIAGAVVGDHWLNETTMELSKITGV